MLVEILMKVDENIMIVHLVNLNIQSQVDFKDYKEMHLQPNI